MGRALLVLIVAIGTALIVFWLAAPRLLSSRNADAAPRGTRMTETSADPISPSSSRNNSTQDSAITSPRTPEEREYEDLEAKRAPFYTWVRQNFSYVSALRPAQEDQATLEIYSRADDPRVVTTLLHDAVAPYGKRYGFRRVRYFLPNSPGSVDRYRLDSESTPDASGVWNTFRK
jgi:hypothetical protein